MVAKSYCQNVLPSMIGWGVIMSTWGQIRKEREEEEKCPSVQMMRTDWGALDQFLNREGWDVNISWVSILCQAFTYMSSARMYCYLYFTKKETDAQEIYSIRVKTQEGTESEFWVRCPTPRLACFLLHGKCSPGAMRMATGWDVQLQHEKSTPRHLGEASNM